MSVTIKQHVCDYCSVIWWGAADNHICPVCSSDRTHVVDEEPKKKPYVPPMIEIINDVDQMVSHPPHYQSKNGLEVIDVIKAFTADLNGTEAYNVGNIIKYICRWKHKDGLRDLKKASWYLNDLITQIENNKKENE